MIPLNPLTRSINSFTFCADKVSPVNFWVTEEEVAAAAVNGLLQGFYVSRVLLGPFAGS